jgi:hypothetical protein
MIIDYLHKDKYKGTCTTVFLQYLMSDQWSENPACRNAAYMIHISLVLA